MGGPGNDPLGVKEGMMPASLGSESAFCWANSSVHATARVEARPQMRACPLLLWLPGSCGCPSSRHHAFWQRLVWRRCMRSFLEEWAVHRCYGQKVRSRCYQLRDPGGAPQHLWHSWFMNRCSQFSRSWSTARIITNNELLFLFPRAALMYYNKLGGLMQQKCILLLEARSPKLRHWLQAMAGVPWHSLTWHSITPISASIFTWLSPICAFTWPSFFWVCLSLCLFSSYKDISHIGLRLTPLLYDLTLFYILIISAKTNFKIRLH